ncbi:hypothetical protein Pmar_PMAR018442, partial [Perkinsus marinus ATCC 50983]
CRLTSTAGDGDDDVGPKHSDERLRHSIAWQLWLLQWLAAAEVSLLKVDPQRRAVECWNVERDLCRVMAHRLHSMANCGISPQQISMMSSSAALEIVEHDLTVLGESPMQLGMTSEVYVELLAGTAAFTDGTLEAAGLSKDWLKHIVVNDRCRRKLTIDGTPAGFLRLTIEYLTRALKTANAPQREHKRRQKRTDDFRRSGRAQLASTINELGCIHLAQLTQLLRSGSADDTVVVALAVDAFCESYSEFVAAGDKLNVMVPLVNLARLWLALATGPHVGSDSIERYQCTYRAIRHLDRAAKSASANKEAESAFSKRDIYATAAEQAQRLGRHLANVFMDVDHLTQEGDYSAPVKVAMEHDVIWRPSEDFSDKVKGQSIGSLASTMLSEALVYAGKAWTSNKDTNDGRGIGVIGPVYGPGGRWSG